MLPPLTLLETRVLGVLVEKQRTVPDTYPLTLNALVAGCTQKSSRDPVIEATDAQVQEAIDRLRTLSLVIESSGGRVMRYAQNIARVLGVPTESAALLATLMLRGPQTPAEIRQNAERLHRFADVSSVEAYLAELSERREGALVRELPRAPSARETRWMHLLSGEPVVEQRALSIIAPPSVSQPDAIALRQEIDTLRAEVAELRTLLTRVMQTLGPPR